jgi:hypothetical protein
MTRHDNASRRSLRRRTSVRDRNKHQAGSDNAFMLVFWAQTGAKPIADPVPAVINRVHA